MELEAVRMMVALGWVAAGFLYEMGVRLEWAEVWVLARLGDGCRTRGESRASRR
jgi:hypothetical protein